MSPAYAYNPDGTRRIEAATEPPDPREIDRRLSWTEPGERVADVNLDAAEVLKTKMERPRVLAIMKPKGTNLTAIATYTIAKYVILSGLPLSQVAREYQISKQRLARAVGLVEQEFPYFQRPARNAGRHGGRENVSRAVSDWHQRRKKASTSVDAQTENRHQAKEGGPI